MDDLEDEAVKSAAHLREATAAVHMSTQRSAESLRSKVWMKYACAEVVPNLFLFHDMILSQGGS